MASNYEVNIKLDTKKAKDQLRELEQRIAKLNRLALKGKASKQILKTERDALALKIKENKLQAQKIRKDKEELKISRDNLRLEKEKAVAIDRQTRAVERKTRTVRAGSMTPMGPSSPLNFTNQGTLLPGPRLGGSTGSGSKGSGAISSAIVSGAFPLLFGQGPLVAGAGALGGGIGSMVGGQMGGFAGGLLATSIVTPIQQFVIEAANLGKALDPATKNVEVLTAALGVTGTEFEKNIKTLKKLGGEEEAFGIAREKMVKLVGKEGVDAMQRFGQGTTELANQFAIAMTQMKSGFVQFMESTGTGQFLLKRMTFTNLYRQAQNSEDTKIQDLLELRKLYMRASFWDSAEDKALKAAHPEIKSAAQATNAVVEQQRLNNEKDKQLTIDKMLDEIQKKRVSNIADEIALLEKSMGLTSDEFEIEKQIMQMKQEGEIKDENEIRNKLKYLQELQKERKLAEETAAAFERMAQSITTDISKGIQGMIRGTSTLNDMLNNVLNKLIDAAFNMAFFGNMQGTLGGGGLFGSIFGGLGGLFGGGGSGRAGKFLDGVPNPFKAEGGPVSGGRSYVVGEKGPELFTPGISGGITPNHALGGSTSISVNVDASGSSVEGNEQNGEEFGRLIAMAIQSELIKEKRPGGLLS